MARIRTLVQRAMTEDAAVRELVDGVQRREVDPLTAVSALVTAVTDGADG